MKRFRTLLTLFLLVVGTAMSWAQDYGISVSTLGGETVSVSGENCADVLGDGSLSYDPSSNVLMMHDVQLYGFAVLDLCQPDLRIVVSGTQNSIEGFCMINTSCTLVGSNTKKSVTSQLNVSSLAWSSSLTIQDVAVEFIGGKQGLQSQSGSASLTLKNATVNANGAAGVFKSIPSLVLEDCEILTPEGAYYDAEKKYIVDESGNRVTGVVTIGPKVEPVVDYGIWIKSSPYDKLEITSENCADVLGDGTVSYDPATNVLLLNNVQAPNKYIVFGELDYDMSIQTMEAMNKDLAGIKVKVAGNNALGSLHFYGGVNGTICGDGNLVLEDETAANSTLHSWDNLLIEDCNLVLKAPDGYGINLWESMGAPGKLTIRNASVKINAGGSCIIGLSKLVLEGCSILKPSGIDPAKLNGSTANGEFIIGRDGSDVPVTKYDIKVGSTKVTKANCADVLGDGTVSYDPVANVLSLNNLQAAEKAVIIGSFSSDPSFEAMKAMNKGLAGIKVKVTGDNALKTLEFYGGVDGTLCGDGTLVLEQPNMTGSAICSFDNLLIEDCNLVLTTPGNGIYMWYDWGWGCPGKLTIRNASVKINAGLECIGDFSSLVLEGCSILKPFGTDPAKLNGSTGGGELIIGRDGSDVPVTEYNIKVGSTKVTKANCADVLGDGTVSYDPVANVLSLNNLQAAEKAVIIGSFSSDPSFEAMKAMNKGLAGIKVKVTGDNALKTLEFYGGVDGTLCGDGTLVLEQPNMTGSAICSFDNLLIEDCNLVLTTPGNGIYMWYDWGWGCPGKLTIRNANVRINARLECIGDFSSLVLEGCSILKPSGTDPAKLNGSTGGGELLIGRTVSPEQGSGTEGDPFVLDDTLDKLLAKDGNGDKEPATEQNPSGPMAGDGVWLTPPAGNSHYRYTAKKDCVMELAVVAQSKFEGKVVINGVACGDIEERAILLHNGDVVTLDIASEKNDNKLGINVRNVRRGEIWYKAIEIAEGHSRMPKIVENKNLALWYKTRVPADRILSATVNTTGSVTFFGAADAEKETNGTAMVAGETGLVQTLPLTSSAKDVYLKAAALDKSCTASLWFKTVTGIDGVETDDAEEGSASYNLAGQRVDGRYRGIVVKKGKKVLKK